MISRRIGLLAASAVLAGCASVTVERTKDLSTAGVKYSQAMAAVSTAAMEAAVDADSADQVRTMPRSVVEDAGIRANRAERLAKLDAGLVKTIVLYSTFERSANALEAYFKGLQALANGSQAEAAEEAVKNLAGRVNSLNAAMEKEATPISDAQINALGGLAKVVATQIHGAVLARALERDGPMIGRALVLQERVLQKARLDIANNLVEANNRFYVDSVEGPYVRGQMSASWPNARLAFLKVKALSQTDAAVSAAEAASKQMQIVWKKILSGEYSTSELLALLKDTDDLLGAAAALKAARKDAGSN